MKGKFENKENRCLCGSGKSYDECCKVKINPNASEGIHKKFMHELDEKRRNYKHICLHPNQGENCGAEARAHTISQQAVLALIAENNHVLMPIVYGITNEFQMKCMGIEKQASTFRCFCDTHDAMFGPID